MDGVSSIHIWLILNVICSAIDVYVYVAVVAICIAYDLSAPINFSHFISAKISVQISCHLSSSLFSHAHDFGDNRPTEHNQSVILFNENWICQLKRLLLTSNNNRTEPYSSLFRWLVQTNKIRLHSWLRCCRHRARARVCAQDDRIQSINILEQNWRLFLLLQQ